MSVLNDRSYYSRRTDEEIASGDKAVNSTVAAIHFELAHRYALLAAGKSVARLTFGVIEGGQSEIAA